MKDNKGPQMPSSNFPNLQKLIIKTNKKPNHTYTKREITKFTKDFPEWKFMYLCIPNPHAEIIEFHFYFDGS